MPVHFATLPTHRIAPQRNAPQCNSLSAAGPTPEEPRDEGHMWKPAMLLQSHSSPELPVSSDESFASSCSLRNTRNDRQPSANPCSLLDPSLATVSGLPERTLIGYRGRGRKYERSRSEVTLLSYVELCGEFRSNDRRNAARRRNRMPVWRAEESGPVLVSMSMRIPLVVREKVLAQVRNKLGGKESYVINQLANGISLALKSVSNVSHVTFPSSRLILSCELLLALTHESNATGLLLFHAPPRSFCDLNVRCWKRCRFTRSIN